MWLVLCESGDRDAFWAGRGLLARGLTPLEYLTAESLVGARRWEHRLGADGISLRVELSDGRLIEGDHVHGVLNRLVGVSSEQLSAVAERDRDYATQELYAFFLSWLAALPGRVLNRPSPQGLSGCWLERSEWIARAARAGLTTKPYLRSSASAGWVGVTRRRLVAPRRSVLVVGRRALGPPGVPPSVVDGCGRLSRSIGAAILGVEFSVSTDGDWTFDSATTMPVLSTGGEQALDLLAAALTGERGR